MADTCSHETRVAVIRQEDIDAAKAAAEAGISLMLEGSAQDVGETRNHTQANPDPGDQKPVDQNPGDYSPAIIIPDTDGTITNRKNVLLTDGPCGLSGGVLLRSGKGGYRSLPCGMAWDLCRDRHGDGRKDGRRIWVCPGGSADLHMHRESANAALKWVWRWQRLLQKTGRLQKITSPERRKTW